MNTPVPMFGFIPAPRGTTSRVITVKLEMPDATLATLRARGVMMDRSGLPIWGWIVGDHVITVDLGGTVS